MIKKKFTTIVSSLLLSILVFSLPTFADAATNNLNSAKTNFPTLRNKFLQQGMSIQDANYYAQLQVKIDNMKLKHQKAPSLKGVKARGENWVRTHQAEFHKEVLALDPAALKEALESSINIMKNGPKDIQALMKHDKKLGIHKNSYTVVYPDGSSITETTSTVRATKKNKNKMTTSTMDSGPWGSESALFNTEGPLSPGTWTTTTNIYFQGGGSSGHVENQLTWTRDSNNNVTATDDTGAASSNGAFTKSASEVSVIHDKYASGGNFIQGYTEAYWQARSPFNVSFESLNVSGGTATTWDQFAIDEVDGYGDVDSWGAYFE